MTYNLDLKSQIISTILGRTEGRSKNMINFSPLSGMKPLDFSLFFLPVKNEILKYVYQKILEQ